MSTIVFGARGRETAITREPGVTAEVEVKEVAAAVAPITREPVGDPEEMHSLAANMAILGKSRKPMSIRIEF